MSIRLRFAPSPTGYLHVGGARTALFNYFLAKAQGGKFILRIEDTDTERNKAEWVDVILDSLKWLGLEWDEGPFFQSQRFDLYRSYVTKLLESKQAYKCYCTPQEVDAMRAEAQKKGEKPMYNRKCRERTEAPEGAPFVVRFKTPLDGEVVIQDGIKGEVRFANKEMDDFVILRTNNAPIYNLTVVVDDIDMKITHVVRAEEHLNNTPKQFLLMKALGWTPPQYAHVPLVLAPDKTKLSKRHGAVAVSQYRDEGYLQEAMLSYLARLGWAHGDQELFTAEELGKLFDLKGCGASGSVFDRTKLDWVNSQFIKKLDPADIIGRVKAVTGVDLLSLLDSPAGKKLYTALAERAQRLPDFVSGSLWFVKEELQIDAASMETIVKVAKPEGLAKLREKLSAVESANWVSEKLGPLFKEAAIEAGLKMPDVAKPARILLTGTLASPDIGLVCEVLGKERTLRRLKVVA